MSIVLSRVEAPPPPRPASEAGDGARVLLVALLMAANFAVDLAVPYGYAAGVLYIVPVLVALGGRSSRLTLVTAAVSALLTMIGLGFSPAGALPWYTIRLISRVLSLFALFATTWAVVAKQRADEERNRAARALAESELRLQIAFQHAPTGIAIQSPDGRFMQVNRAASEMLGYPPEELIGRFIADITHPDDLERVMTARASLAEHSATRIETRFVRPDGGIVWVQLSLVLVSDPDSVPLYVIAQGQDVTAQRAAEAALRESEERFRIAFGQAPTGIAVRARDGTYLQINESLSQMLGRPSEAFLGRRPWEFAQPDDAEMLRARDQTLLERGDHARTSCRFVDAAGHIVPTRLTSSLVTTPDRAPLYFVDQVEDITRELAEAERHRRLEEQLRRAQKMEAIGRLAGGIAHDFNNMLSIILNYATLAERRLGADSPARPDLAAIRDAGNRAATLTRQLLLFAGRHAAAPSPIPIDVTVANIAQLLRRTLGEDIDVVVRLGAADAHVLADPSHLEQVLMNLGVNARDAMPDGGQLLIGTSLVEAAIDDTIAIPGQRVVITVSDTGAGMSAEIQARAFEPFYTTKPVGQGTGLGLAIVYGIVEQAGGQIELHSVPGHGTTFRILLPTHEPPVERPAGEPPTAMSPRGRGEWVLVVEDEPALRTLTARLLSGRGYNVLVARDGVDALEVLERHSGPLHLLLTDVVMPRMSGRELATRVTALRPDVRVLYVSGHAEDRIARHRLLHAGAALLSKPFHMDDLLRRVRDMLDEARPPDEDRYASH